MQKCTFFCSYRNINDAKGFNPVKIMAIIGNFEGNAGYT